MKKLVLVCAALAAFAFVACNSNKTAAPVEAEVAEVAEVATEEGAVVENDSICPETGKVCDMEQKAECEKVCDKKEAAE